MATINGTNSPDNLLGGAENDTIIGGGGGGGNDTINGGGGFNVAAYWTSTSGVGVQMFDGQVINDGLGGRDQLFAIQGVIGSAHNDVILGTNLSDLIIGLGGNDTLQGLDGDDLIRGNEGNDSIDGGGGTDRIFYDGNRADFTVTALSGGGFTIADKRAARDGTDTVRNGDVLEFNDGTVTAANLLSGTVTPPPPPPPSGSEDGDFNADGRSDVLWRHVDGSLAIWQMNGAAVAGGGVFSAGPGAFWRVADTGDFNGDGRDDILWRGIDGSLAVWQMNGTTVAGGGVVGAITTDWQVVAT
jgi:VCBS repeat protein/hemolysin type calcium-binding protein